MGLGLLFIISVLTGCAPTDVNLENTPPSQATTEHTNTAIPTRISSTPTTMPNTTSPASPLPTTGMIDSGFFQETDVGIAMLAYLNCEDFDCFETLKVIVELGPNAVPPLVELLEHGPPPNVPELAGRSHNERVIEALGELQDARAIDPLIPYLNDPNPVLRAKAVSALGQIGGTGLSEALSPLLQDADQFVREMTATALGQLGQLEALPALRAAAQVEAQAHVRQAMEEAIELLETH